MDNLSLFAQLPLPSTEEITSSIEGEPTQAVVLAKQILTPKRALEDPKILPKLTRGKAQVFSREDTEFQVPQTLVRTSRNVLAHQNPISEEEKPLPLTAEMQEMISRIEELLIEESKLVQGQLDKFEEKAFHIEQTCERHIYALFPETEEGYTLAQLLLEGSFPDQIPPSMDSAGIKQKAEIIIKNREILLASTYKKMKSIYFNPTAILEAYGAFIHDIIQNKYLPRAITYPFIEKTLILSSQADLDILINNVSITLKNKINNFEAKYIRINKKLI